MEATNPINKLQALSYNYSYHVDVNFVILLLEDLLSIKVLI